MNLEEISQWFYQCLPFSLHYPLVSYFLIQPYLAVFVFSFSLHLLRCVAFQLIIYLFVGKPCLLASSLHLIPPRKADLSLSSSWSFFKYHHLCIWKALLSLWSHDLTSTPTWSWLNRLMAACHPSAEVTGCIWRHLQLVTIIIMWKLCLQLYAVSACRLHCHALKLSVHTTLPRGYHEICLQPNLSLLFLLTQPLYLCGRILVLSWVYSTGGLWGTLSLTIWQMFVSFVPWSAEQGYMPICPHMAWSVEVRKRNIMLRSLLRLLLSRCINSSTLAFKSSNVF